MKYKEFVNWCNQRSCDGYWSPGIAIHCSKIIEDIKSEPFWRRNKVWKEKYEARTIEKIIKPTEEKIKNTEV